jgi:hypothetical protein
VKTLHAAAFRWITRFGHSLRWVWRRVHHNQVRFRMVILPFPIELREVTMAGSPIAGLNPIRAVVQETSDSAEVFQWNIQGYLGHLVKTVFTAL